MLCEVCGKNQATFFYKQTKNGFTTEKNLCHNCAKSQGLSIGTGFFDIDGTYSDDFFGGFLGSFLDSKPHIVSSQRCEKCGMTLAELLQNGRVGCDGCYGIFRKSLMPTVTKIHGNVKHCGKRPETLSDPPETPVGNTEPIKEEKIASLKEKLQSAIEKQEYEDAAKFRDMIKELEKNEGGDEK